MHLENTVKFHFKLQFRLDVNLTLLLHHIIMHVSYIFSCNSKWYILSKVCVSYKQEKYRCFGILELSALCYGPCRGIRVLFLLGFCYLYTHTKISMESTFFAKFKNSKQSFS